MMPSIDKLCERMRYWCDEGNLGYCQEHRQDIRVGGEADCSSLVIHCLKEAGFDTGSASYTGNMSANLCARGWRRVANNGNPQRGDILLNDAHHVAVYIGNGLLCQASRNELHRANGGQPGDQDGYETNTRGYYNYPWSCYLRYAGAQESTSPTLVVDGYWGRETTLRLQELLGCPYKDGVISSQWAGDAWRHAACTSFEHDSSGEGSVTIARMQQRLGVTADGLCGKDTINALIKRFMPSSGATVLDGKLDAASVTVKAMQRAINEGSV